MWVCFLTRWENFPKVFSFNVSKVNNLVVSFSVFSTVECVVLPLLQVFIKHCLISSSYILIPFSPCTSILDIKHTCEEINDHSHVNINNPSSFQCRLFSSQCAMRQTDRRLILPVIGNFALSDLDFGQHCPVRRRSRTWRSPPASLCHIFLSLYHTAWSLGCHTI